MDFESNEVPFPASDWLEMVPSEMERVTLLMVTQGFIIMVTKECRIVVTADLY